MPAITHSLLVKFHARDTCFGVTRDTVKALAGKLGVTETQAVHMALAKLAGETLHAYEPDNGGLTARQIASVRRTANAGLPRGKRLDKQSLF